jgi:hypothetical protein
MRTYLQANVGNRVQRWLRRAKSALHKRKAQLIISIKIFLFNQQKIITKTAFAEYLNQSDQPISLLPDLGRRCQSSGLTDEGWRQENFVRTRSLLLIIHQRSDFIIHFS